VGALTSHNPIGLHSLLTRIALPFTLLLATLHIIDLVFICCKYKFPGAIAQQLLYSLFVLIHHQMYNRLTKCSCIYIYKLSEWLKKDVAGNDKEVEGTDKLMLCIYLFLILLQVVILQIEKSAL
jgi:hypothetical protein